MDEIKYTDWPPLYEAPLGEMSNKYMFISYSHEDTDIVYQDLKVLSTNGARVWYDRAMHIGQNWVERAKHKIFDKNCAGVIFYVSKNSLVSDAFLQELDYTIQRSKDDLDFTYLSVNIGEKNAFELLKTLDVTEEKFLKVLLAFNKNKLFIPRSTDPFHTRHFLQLIETFEQTESIDMSKCVINQTELFLYSEYEQGLQIVKYKGSDQTVSIPSNFNGKKVISVGINAFRNNSNIRKVSIPEGVRIIDDFAFSCCINLESIALPNSLTTVGYEAFRECYSLRSIVLPYNVEKIGDYCFYKCHQLKNITMLSIVPLSIEFAAFSECHSFDVISLPESTVSIGPYAFNNCINMLNITIPKSVKKIGLSAFYGCASLSFVALQTTGVLENNRWFSRCPKLKCVQVAAEKMRSYLSDSSWDVCKEKLSFKLSTPNNINFEDGLIFWDGVDVADYYIVTVNNSSTKTTKPFYKTAEINDSSDITVRITAYSYDERIAESDISNEIKIETATDLFEISYSKNKVLLNKYNGNTSVVHIPSEVTDIADEAFYNHEEIRSIEFPENLHTIGNRAFYHCVGVQKIELPLMLYHIGDEAFWGASIRELTLPANISCIGKSAFACCNYLAELNIIPSKMMVGNKAFYRCINLTKVRFINGFEELSNGMFRGCTELGELSLPNGLRAIRSGSVSYIMRLQRIFIPKSVEVIEESSFSNSFGLSEIYVDPENTNYYDDGGVLFSNNHCLLHYPADKKSSEYIVGDCVEEISNYAFMDVEHLQKLMIGNGVRIIGESAFERCPNLEEIVINSDVEIIKKNAFRDCINLKRLFLLSGVVPEIEPGLFDNVGQHFKIIVPQKYIKNYTRIIEWKDYYYLIQPLRE